MSNQNSYKAFWHSVWNSSGYGEWYCDCMHYHLVINHLTLHTTFLYLVFLTHWNISNCAFLHLRIQTFPLVRYQSVFQPHRENWKLVHWSWKSSYLEIVCHKTESLVQKLDCVGTQSRDSRTFYDVYWLNSKYDKDRGNKTQDLTWRGLVYVASLTWIERGELMYTGT